MRRRRQGILDGRSAALAAIWASVVLDGVGDAEVQGGLERHGLDVAEGVVPELELRVQQ
jgi:hypothetical protein